VARQAYAGLLFSKQFYHYVVEEWIKGDSNQPPPPNERRLGRNHNWGHLFNRDVISMPDKWEYPWVSSRKSRNSSSSSRSISSILTMMNSDLYAVTGTSIS
jgi:hypothetical protein